MDYKDKQKKYNEYVSKKAPKSKILKSLVLAFLIGGLICVIGQGLHDAIIRVFPGMYETEVNTWMLSIIIATTILLTGFGVWDEVGYFAGAFIPITGFANAISSPAIEFKHEGIIFGLCVKMFVVAGPIIVNGIALSVIAGLLYYIF